MRQPPPPHATPPHLRLYCPHRFLFPSHPSSPSHPASVLAARRYMDHTSFADPRHKHAPPRIYVMDNLHGPSQVESWFGILFCWICILLYMGSFHPLSCVFRPRPPALYACFTSFTLVFCRRTPPHPLRPCARCLASDLLTIRALICTTNVAAKVCRRQDT